MNQCQRCGGYFGVHRGWCRMPDPEPATTLTAADASTLNRAGLTLPEWQALTDKERADIRWRLGA